MSGIHGGVPILLKNMVDVPFVHRGCHSLNPVISDSL